MSTARRSYWRSHVWVSVANTRDEVEAYRVFLESIDIETRLCNFSGALNLRLKESKSFLNVPQSFLKDCQHPFVDLPPCGDTPSGGPDNIRRCRGRRIVHLRQLLVIRNRHSKVLESVLSLYLSCQLVDQTIEDAEQRILTSKLVRIFNRFSISTIF